jgi:hypothetical protein
MTAAGQKPCSQPAVVSIAIAPTIPATVTTCINPAVAPESRRRAQSPGSPVAKQTARAAIPASKTFTAAGQLPVVGSGKRLPWWALAKRGKNWPSIPVALGAGDPT